MNHRLRVQQPQRGSVAVMVALLIVALIGMLGIVIDLSNLYVRKTELQNAADAAALAGAKQLDNHATGIDAAVAAAIALAAANASDFAQTPVAIAAAHISFGPTPDGPWSDVATAKANPMGLTFIKVDTNGIAQGTRPTWFMPVVNSALASTTANGVAVAGTTICEGLPIFICEPPTGFTPGQTYFFGESPGYPVGPGNIGYFDPVPPGAPGLITGANDMRDIVCAGKTYCLGSPMTAASLTQSAFGTMARAINTRFDDYASLPPSLNHEVCRPDTNVKEYPPTPTGVPWMTTTPGDQLSVYWSAVRPATMPGTPPVNGSYPAAGSGGGTPYTQPPGSIFNQQPSVAHRPSELPGRRIMTMAIVSNCGSITGSGKPVNVVGYGRFFLPVKAVGTGNPKGIYVEFIETISALKASPPDIKLYR